MIFSPSQPLALVFSMLSSGGALSLCVLPALPAAAAPQPGQVWGQQGQEPALRRSPGSAGPGNDDLRNACWPLQPRALLEVTPAARCCTPGLSATAVLQQGAGCCCCCWHRGRLQGPSGASQAADGPAQTGWLSLQAGCVSGRVWGQL